MQRYSGALGGVLALAALVFLLGPAYMRHALSALLVISRSVEAAAPYRIEVTPGNNTIPRGADQAIAAKLLGFQSDQAVLMIRKSPTARVRARAARPHRGQRYEGTLFDVAAPVEYFVEAVGVRSPIYTLKVADMPYVQKLELEYHFPAYTGLAPRKIEDGGDIAVLRGTEVRVRAVTTMKADGRRDRDRRQDEVPMTSGADGALMSAFTADHDGFYRIELEAAADRRSPARRSTRSTCSTDQPPTVSFVKPGRDTSASPIEEVFLEAKAEDDYGIKSLELVYSVNGGAEKTRQAVRRHHADADVSAGHTLYIEEMGVKPGDSVSYYARAFDNDTVAGPQKATSDLYFVRVRPLPRTSARPTRRPAAAAEAAASRTRSAALSEQQRQIIAATFNLQRDRKTSGADKTKEGAVVAGADAEAAARAGQRAADQLRDARRQPGGALQEDHRLPEAGDPRDADRRRQAAGGDARMRRCRRSTARSSPCRRRKRNTSCRSERQQQQGGGGGGGGSRRWPTSSPTCSSSKSTRWPTSTRPRSAPRSSRPTRRSTSSPRS